MAQEKKREKNKEKEVIHKQFVTFALGKEIYGLDIMAAESIERLSRITRVPKTPEYILGVTNVRGTIIPIINLGERLGLLHQEYDENTRIIILSFQENRVGILVNEVKDVLSVPEATIQTGDGLFKDKKNGMISSVIRLDGEYILVLDLKKVLDLGE